MTSCTALIGPANMKSDLVAHATALTMKALADRALQERYVEAGATPLPSSAEISKLRNDEWAAKTAPAPSGEARQGR